MIMAAEMKSIAANRVEALSALNTVLDEACMHHFSCHQARSVLQWYPLPELPPGRELDFDPLVELACALHQRVVDPWASTCR